MSELPPARSGSAEQQSSLWRERARDWADVMEGWSGWAVPVYQHLVQFLTVERGVSLLDVGCGAGRFARMAADRGATVAGLDATPPFIEIAGERTPEGDFRVGDMEALPWDDGSFDVVTGFNSFFIAADIVAALAEARRVARPGGSVAMTAFGRPDRCQSSAIFASIQQLMPKSSNDGEPIGPGLHEEGVLEERAAAAGLTPGLAGYLEFAEEYPDLETMVRGYMAAAPFVRASRVAGEEAVRETLTEALGPFERPDGRYRLEDEVRFLIATA